MNGFEELAYKALLMLAELAKQTREAQRTYFKTRTQDALVRSKILEARLDKAAKAIEQRDTAAAVAIMEGPKDG
jgi:hypothetical protein